MHRLTRFRTPAAVATLLAVLCGPALADTPADRLRERFRGVAADSLATRLRALEAPQPNEARSPTEIAEVSLLLGRLHYARGEYALAADAFTRAAARLEPARKHEARYWAGLSWIALGRPSQARAVLEEVARSTAARRIDAQLGVAQAWELSQRELEAQAGAGDRAVAAAPAQRALEELDGLLQGDPGEAGPAALERAAALAGRLGKPDAARRYRERLLQSYPRSIEAATARLELSKGAGEVAAGNVAVVIGSFVDLARARALAAEAKRAGFPDATVVTRGQGLTAVHAVRLGTYATRGEARRAGEDAARALGVTHEIVGAAP